MIELINKSTERETKCYTIADIQRILNISRPTAYALLPIFMRSWK